MFREMRRKKQLLTPEERAAVLHRGTSGVLALAGDDGYPYAVPMSYVYDGAKLYFHCAKSGHKLDAIRREARASFCVVDRDEVVPEEYTTYFRSVIVFGRIHPVEDAQKTEEICRNLCAKFNDDPAYAQGEWEKSGAHVRCLALTPEHMTGKQVIES